MSKQKSNLGYLGQNFQLQLINQLIVDEKFSSTIIDILDPTYFDSEYLRLICAEIKNYFEKYHTIPMISTIEQIINQTVTKEITKEYVIETLQEVKNIQQKDCLYVQDTAIKFCKQQELKKANKKIERILESGDFERYEECVEIMKKAVSVGLHKETGIKILDGIDDVLSDDFRRPVATGITGLDNLMDGGLSKGELGVIIAPFGVGKSTMITKLANTAYNLGYNVVQIFFEDNPKVMQRKHFTCWTGIPLNDLSDNNEKVKEMVTNIVDEKTNHLLLKKFPSSGTNIPQIEQYLKQLISDGIRPDIVLLDYIDCVVPTRHYDDEYSGEGDVMRQFETMIAELDIVGWTAVQGNRSSINAEIVDSSMIGGSIKKGQIGHFIVSIAKNLQQKEDGLATMAILKSRFGKDGIVFQDIVFDNSRLVIDTTQTSTVNLLDMGKFSEKKNQERVMKALDNAEKNKTNYLKNKIQ
jgi:hypothetical protein